MKPTLRSFTLQAFPMQCMTDASTSAAGKCVEKYVQVCNICGDIGFQEALITCRTCDEGAEHFYCVSALNFAFAVHKREGGTLSSFTHSSIQCEGCKLKAEKINMTNYQNFLRNDVASKAPYMSLKTQQTVRGYHHFRSSDLLGNAIGSSSQKRNFEGPPYHQLSTKRQVDHAKGSVGAPPMAVRNTFARSREWTKKHSSRTPHSGKVKFISPKALRRERKGKMERI